MEEETAAAASTFARLKDSFTIELWTETLLHDFIVFEIL